MILHITTTADWAAGQRRGVYVAPSLEREGFIHCSTLAQVVETANTYYQGASDLLLLLIDERRTRAELRHESPAGATARAELFPHLYGPLNLDAVTQVVELSPGPDGRFALPPQLSALVP